MYGPAPGWLAPAAQRQEGTGLCLCAEAVPMCHVSCSYLWACLSVCIPQPGQRPQVLRHQSGFQWPSGNDPGPGLLDDVAMAVTSLTRYLYWPVTGSVPNGITFPTVSGIVLWSLFDPERAPCLIKFCSCFYQFVCPQLNILCEEKLRKLGSDLGGVK